MKRKRRGQYVTISLARKKAQAFIPIALPPRPPVAWTPELRIRYDNALLALGRLDCIATFLSDNTLLLPMYVRKEAVLSSRIEGIHVSLSDVLLFELDMKPEGRKDEIREVSNHVSALNYGLQKIHEGFPISIRLLKELHYILFAKGAGSRNTPGEFRRAQNWIGGTRPDNAVFVPPPPHKVMECMGKLEFFLNDQPEPTSALIKAALSHVQFETIHPFTDGNGRIGRLLITLLLCNQAMPGLPLLYLSMYFNSHRRQYYKLLDNVRETGDWEAWLDFFIEAVIVTATHAEDTARRLLEMEKRDRERINSMGRAAVSILRIHQALLERPVTAAKWLTENTGITPATVNKCLGHLERMGIVKEITERRRNRVFKYTGYMEIMNQGV